jgi:hypothetical protein
MARMFFLRDRLDKETLERLHLRAGLSYVEIAERFGTRSGNVIKLMDEYGIPRRVKRVRKPPERLRALEGSSVD